MPTTTPRQAVQQIRNNSTIRNKSTTIGLQQIELMESKHNNIASRSDGKCPKMTNICSRGNIPVGIATQFRSNHLRQQGYHHQQKNGEDRSRTFWAHQTRTTSTNRKQFWHSGSPEVITDGAIRHKTKFLIFSSGGTICLSRVVLELKREKEIEKKIGCYGNVPWGIENRASDRSSTAIAETNSRTLKPRGNPSSGSWDNSADRNRYNNNNAFARHSASLPVEGRTYDHPTFWF